MNDEERNRLIGEVRRILAIGEAGFRKTKGSLPLDEQRKILEEKVRKILSIYDLTDLESSFDEIKDIVEDFLCSSITVPTIDIQAKQWSPWLTEERKSTISWRYSNRYLSYLLAEKKWKETVVASIASSTDDILNHCGDPLLKNDFSIKGLVVGDVQSGKTANYTSLINKAIDAGYKVIIVLTGITNELRSQTQKRLDKEVLGLKTDIDSEKEETDRNVDYGVSKYGRLSGLNVLTSADLNGDLKKPNGVYSVGGMSPCYLAVIKKSPTTLKKVIQFLKRTVTSDVGKKGKMAFPLLLIDDEADLASVNTNKDQELQKSTGTNKSIREILYKNCAKFTYVGYTATPFANIFIAPHEKYSNEDDSDDIFPSDFIITLKTPSDYSGPLDFFGVDENTQDDDTHIRRDLLVDVDPKDLQSFVGDDDAFLPAAEKECMFIPDSLRIAVMCFLISAGARISRGYDDNNTMLINVDIKRRFNSTLRDNVKQVFDSACKNYLYDEATREKYKEYWEKNYRKVSQERLKEKGLEFKDSWDKIDEGIRKAIRWKTDSSVKLVIGKADTVDYSQSDHNIFVCVGGQKLSRGLTLEGLTVSYYGRNAQSIDSLLQMGRWFGYRKGWLDLCRVFATKDIASDFVEAAIVTEGFKRDVRWMSENGATPRTFGFRVRAASRLLPTAKNKMRSATKEKISFSASLSQLLDFDTSFVGANLELVRRFISCHDNGRYVAERKDFYSPIFRNIASKDIIDLLKSYKTPSSLVQLWVDYISTANKYKELTKWTVVLSSTKGLAGDGVTDVEKIGNYVIHKAVRTLRQNGHESSNIIKIRVLTSPGDYVGFFPDGITPKSDKYDWQNDDVLQKYYTPENGILVIYVFDPLEREDEGFAPKTVVQNARSTVGFGIWFPRSNVFEEEFVFANPVEEERLHSDGDASKAQYISKEEGK